MRFVKPGLQGKNGAVLVQAMQWFGVAYTSRFNLKNQRSGHLFQGRFKSMLVETRRTEKI